MKTLILDNYDSFTFNLYQYCAEIGANPEVFRNDEITLEEIEQRGYTHIVISPGPGTPANPKDFGVCGEVIRHFKDRLPILGVCLGHQGIIHFLGGRVIRAPVPMHGKRSMIHINTAHPLFSGLPEKIEAMRYHSLIGEAKTLPKDLEVIGETDNQLIMAISHKTLPLYGVQFHPESVGTPLGKDILRNFFKATSKEPLRESHIRSHPRDFAEKLSFTSERTARARRPKRGSGFADPSEGRAYTIKEAEAFIDEIVNGTATEDEIEDILLALSRKGESVAEIVGMARGLRKHAIKLPHGASAQAERASGFAGASEAELILMDTCGTGGSGLPRMNISTTAAFVLAAGGVKIAKHGNRSASGRSGSFDLLEALGCKIDLPPEIVAHSIEKLGIGFLFAPLFHPAMKRVALVRKKLGVQTIFNLLGPLTNPAQPAYHLLGTTSVEIGKKLIEAMKGLNYTRAMVVIGEDGLDDITLTGKTTVFDFHNGKISKFEFSPEEVDMKRVKNFDEIPGRPSLSEATSLTPSRGWATFGSPEKNAELFLALLHNKAPEALQNLLLLNAAFGFVVRGVVPDVKAGIELAKKTIESGAAYAKFLAYKNFTNGSFS